MVKTIPNPAALKAEIAVRIDQYFGDVPHTTTITVHNHLADVEILYTDFKCVRTLRRDIEDLHPAIDEVILHRDYSDAVMTEALHRLDTDAPTLYAMTDQGDQIPVSVLGIVFDNLQIENAV